MRNLTPLLFSWLFCLTSNNFIPFKLIYHSFSLIQTDQHSSLYNAKWFSIWDPISMIPHGTAKIPHFQPVKVDIFEQGDRSSQRLYFGRQIACKTVQAKITSSELSFHVRSLHCSLGVAFLGSEWQSILLHNYLGWRRTPATDTLLSHRCTGGSGTCQEEEVAMDRDGMKANCMRVEGVGVNQL